MTGPVIALTPPDAARLAPYGRFVTPPDVPGKRQFYSDALHRSGETSVPVLHVNSVLPQTLPIQISQVECHPYSAQCFFPLDVAHYIVMVMPSDAGGLPCTDRALAFLVPGTMGAIYNPGVWHLGATVLDRPGHFAVLMWRGGPFQDDMFRSIVPLTVVAST